MRNWTVSMLGAREHYALPRILHAQQALAQFHTDLWAGKGNGVGLLSKLHPRMRGRIHSDLKDASVRSYPFWALGWQTELRKLRSSSRTALYQAYAEQGREFALKVGSSLQRASGEGQAFLGFSSASLETLEAMKGQGWFTVVDQIDPARVEEKLVAEERERWPGWQAASGAIPDVYFDRLEEEWDLADRVLVNSEWSRKALLRQGVPEEKLQILPLAYEPPELPDKPVRHGDLHVLWLGSVNLRKGFPYVLEAARRLEGKGVQFTVAGTLEIEQGAMGSLPSNLKFLGPVPRIEVSDIYQQADIFVLPTLSDGFAITQLEAMAHGLPVVTTSHCGKVVRDGVDGRVMPIRHAEILADTLADLAEHPDQVKAMSEAAQERVKEFSLSRLGERFQETFGDA